MFIYIHHIAFAAGIVIVGGGIFVGAVLLPGSGNGGDMDTSIPLGIIQVRIRPAFLQSELQMAVAVEKHRIFVFGQEGFELLQLALPLAAPAVIVV